MPWSKSITTPTKTVTHAQVQAVRPHAHSSDSAPERELESQTCREQRRYRRTEPRTEADPSWTEVRFAFTVLHRLPSAPFNALLFLAPVPMLPARRSLFASSSAGDRTSRRHRPGRCLAPFFLLRRSSVLFRSVLFGWSCT